MLWKDSGETYPHFFYQSIKYFTLFFATIAICKSLKGKCKLYDEKANSSNNRHKPYLLASVSLT
jgi:hypothetical protein